MIGCLLFFISMLLCVSLQAEEKPFFAVQSKENLACPCEFNESIKSANEGSYGAGPKVLVIAPNEKIPFALSNLGQSDIKMEPARQDKYECEKGNIYSPSWKAGNSIIEAHLKVDSPGEESCWFNGTLTLRKNSSKKTINIKGACGC